MPEALTPAQQQAFNGLRYGLTIGNILMLTGDSGMGRTTVLRHLHGVTGGAFVTMKDFFEAMRGQHPFALEETFERFILETLHAHDTVIVDDLDLLSSVVAGCGGAYPRPGLLEAAGVTIGTYAAEAGKHLVVGSRGSALYSLSNRSYCFGIREFKVEDYGFLCRRYLGDRKAARIDWPKVYRFAPNLDAHQLKAACLWLRAERKLGTEGFIDYLRSQHLVSNVDLEEVQQVDLRDLKGIDDLIESLEANIILPLENDDLAQELDLKPKRGVLLAGPPGTGKTTVGRALAHRLKSKFFLVDGTFISGTGQFYGRIHRVFEAAKHNAPSVIFIDDSDVIFESGEESGLYRYLLTMLDGLESETVGQVCVMLTAMDVGNLPPALLRSGRVELWLEMRLPNEHARAAILHDHLANLPASVGAVEIGRLVGATEGFTGADLKRLVEDGKLLLAHDRVRGVPPRPVTEYFLSAVETVAANKERYAAAEARARQQRPSRPPWFSAYPDMSYAEAYEE
jgi:transitional endoplasmic reticulum ATPase